MDLSQNVEDQNRKQMQNVSIQNVSHLQKQDVCLKDKDDQLFLRKRAVAQGVGGKPTNVKTFAKRKKAMMGGFMARRMGMIMIMRQKDKPATRNKKNN